MTELQTTTVTATLLENEKDAKRYLRAAGVVGPSLHPDIHSDNKWKRWNGWNLTAVAGVDANNQAVSLKAHHYASGHTDYSVGVNGDTPHLGTNCFQRAGIEWPITAFPAVPILRHPEYTPRHSRGMP